MLKGNKDPGKFANAFMLSGPIGCGKTAAVYAVARELGFEVFEINPGSRRSGKDVLERIGAMTRNHLVQGPNETCSLPSEDDSLSVAAASSSKDNRQELVASFFKPKAKPLKANPGKVTTKQAPVSMKGPPKIPPKQQKQSLILLEEVDTLYEDDKQFWATIMTLITTSRRPIVMTCNDETAVPLASLSLHAIARFSPPPVDLAVDYLLLLAANEGHLLRHEAVRTLYEGRNLDLRASIMELNFWCQFGIGDPKKGFSWIEPGLKVDEQGLRRRVISSDTYQPGMGWLCRDHLTGDLPAIDVEQ